MIGGGVHGRGISKPRSSSRVSALSREATENPKKKKIGDVSS